MDNIPNSLRDWVVDNIRLGRQIGRGANGRILEAVWEGTEVAVKEIHSVFMNEVSEQEFQALKQRFLRECEQSSRLRHPKIVRFFGIYLPPGARVPSLVMERLHCSLTNLLEQNPVIPIGTKLKILYDVSLGVRYLHSRNPPIIHRDLSSNNILLSVSERMEAKVGDLGTARLVDPIKQSKMTTAPGTIHFMPPEALVDTLESIRYGKELDVFSFGCVMLHTLSHQWPTPSEPVVTDPVTFEVKGRTEVERRNQYFSAIDGSKLGLLLSLIESCLSNLPKNRTSIVTLCEQLEGLVEKEHLLKVSLQPLALQTKDSEIKKKDMLVPHLGTQKDELDIDGLVSDMSSLQSLSPYQSPAQVRTLTPSLTPDISGREIEHDAVKQLIITEAKTPSPSTESVTPVRPSSPIQKQVSGNHLKFTWQECADLPIKALALSVTELDGKLYAGVDDIKRCFDTPLVYDIHKDCWSALPKLPYLRFSLVSIPNRKQLLAIGGSVVDGKATNKVFLWNEKDDKWLNQYPDMPTARCLSSCISHGSSVIAAGGATSWEPKAAIRAVEVLHIADNHSFWSAVKHLPIAVVGAVPLIINDNLYIAGGYNKHNQSVRTIMTTSLPQLLQSSNKSHVWNRLPDMPYTSQSINHYQGRLIIFSGDYMDKQTKRWTLSPMIYIYNFDTKSWDYVAESPIEYLFDLSIHISDSQIFLVGGLTGTHDGDKDDDLVTTCMLSTITPQ